MDYRKEEGSFQVFLCASEEMNDFNAFDQALQPLAFALVLCVSFLVRSSLSDFRPP